jgi:hypothetical protein
MGSQQNSKNLKAAFNAHANWIYNHIVKTMRPYDYIIAVGSSRAVLQCSDGKPEESVTCQRLIGWSIAKNYLRYGGQLSWDATY